MQACYVYILKKKVMELPHQYLPIHFGKMDFICQVYALYMCNFELHHFTNFVSSCRYRVGHAGTSQARATRRPTNLDLWNLRASMSNAYEEVKDDVDDVKAILQLNEQFSQIVSLRYRTESFQWFSHVTEYMWCSPRLPSWTLNSLYVTSLDLHRRAGQSYYPN